MIRKEINSIETTYKLKSLESFLIMFITFELLKMKYTYPALIIRN